MGIYLMSALQREPSGVYHILIRYEGQRFKRSLGTKSYAAAHSRQLEIDETIELVERQRLAIPDDVFAIEFFMAGGRNPERLPKKRPTPRYELEQIRLKTLIKEFFASIPDGNLEANTLKTMQTHLKHLKKFFKRDFAIQNLTVQELQAYVNHRAKQRTQFFSSTSTSLVDVKGSGPERKTVSAATIRKEIATLGTLWRWGVSAGVLAGDFPKHRIRLPKSDEKPPFQTMDEIERQIKVDRLNVLQAEELWHCLYLRTHEVQELLAYLESKTESPKFLYPMIYTAAHSGARRSELLRAKKSDFDFQNQTLTIHERKRVRGQRSSRRVPMSDSLSKVMDRWIHRDHPGGTAVFCQHVVGKVEAIAKISPDQSHKYFVNAFRGSRWEKVCGWHCLRHSFISNLASAGVDQRIIDDFVGHTTEEMRRRYRHLLPSVKQEAIASVFK